MKPQEAWDAAYHQLELQLDRASFDTWLRQATFLRYEEAEGVTVIGVPSQQACDMLQYRLYRNISRVLSDVTGERAELRFEVHRPQRRDNGLGDIGDADDMPLFQLLARQASVPPPPEEDDTTTPDAPPESDSTGPSLRQLVQHPRRPDLPESELNPRYTFERFIVNHSNQVVHDAALAVVDYPATVYNPFLIYGGVGLGKTHLLQAIAHRCTARGLRTIYIPSEVFTNDLVNAIRNRTTAMFREKYRTVDVLLVDDIQFISGKESTQEEFFHTFNALVNFNKQIVLASDRHPREMATLEDRLQSRFQGGLVADIQAPEFETRVAILSMWASERGIELSNDVLEMLAQRVPRNIRELEGVFNQILAQSLRDGRISLPQAASTIERHRQPRERRVTLEQVIEAVAQVQGLNAADITGKGRTSRVNRARQIAMYLAREMTDCSLPQIGEALGGRRHTTVLHGANKIAEELEQDRLLEARLNKIRRLAATGRF